MNLSNPAIAQLYQQLQTFPFVEEGTEFSFLDRLADDNNWLPAHAADVLEEYRRFLILALFAGHPVTPSDDVDQAWHLHLLYSHSYWDELCGQVLKRSLHHQPTRGWEQERQKFIDQYARTLKSYVQIFGEFAPPDIWPAPDVRFAGTVHFQRVDMRLYGFRHRPLRPFWAKAGGAVGICVGLWVLSWHPGLAAIAGIVVVFGLFNDGCADFSAIGGSTSGGVGCGGCGCGTGAYGGG